MVIINVVLVSLCACLVSTDVPGRCSITPDIVPCPDDGNSLKMFFNATNRRCSKASQWPTRMCVASGQSGFDDYQSCVHTCICSKLPLESKCPKDTDTSRSSEPRWFFDQKAGVCEAFTNYGCLEHFNFYRSRNNFFTESSCKQECVCTKPLHVGTGDQDIEAYAFNVDEKRCVQFSYKGQGGNANRFPTNEECMEKCLCGLEAQNGDGQMTCLAYIPKWVYDKKEGLCKRFIYGGCGGNSNRFNTKDECSEACER